MVALALYSAGSRPKARGGGGGGGGGGVGEGVIQTLR